MKSRVILILAVLLSLLLPSTASAAGPKKAPAAGTYTSSVTSLGDDGAYQSIDTIALSGTLLTDQIRSAADWSALAAAPLDQTDATASVQAAGAQALAATSYKTIGRRYTAYNSIGWIVIRYTIWQEFGYNGTNITYYPPPTYDHQSNWGWSLLSHSETAWWITSPTYRTSRGNFFFKQGVWSPFGDIHLSEVSGWVQLYYRGNGTWTGTNF